MKKLLLLATCLACAGCQSGAGLKPADIYPQMPPNSTFERHITTVWGQTKVVYTTGPALPAVK